MSSKSALTYLPTSPPMQNSFYLHFPRNGALLIFMKGVFLTLQGLKDLYKPRQLTSRCLSFLFYRRLRTSGIFKFVFRRKLRNIERSRHFRGSATFACRISQLIRFFSRKSLHKDRSRF